MNRIARPAGKPRNGSTRRAGSGSRSSLQLSPSQYHLRIMDETIPSMMWSGGDVRAWQRRLRAKVAELTGLADMAGPRVPLNVRSLWRREHPLGTIEKIAFTAEPGADVLAYVCLPKDVPPPYTFFVCLQGHSTGMHNSIDVPREDDGLTARSEGDRDFALECLRRGMAALCIEQRSFGERREKMQKERAPNACHDAAMQGILLGRTLIGQRVFDVDRGIDYLAQRGDVDMDRLGVMGNSGGGTVTLFAAALLPRVKIAMPSCYFCSFRESILSIYHCACNYVPRLFQYAEMGDVLGLFAPRPLIVVAGRQDPIFPLSGVRKQFAHLRRIYAAAGAADRCRLVIGPEGHRFYASLAWPKACKALAAL